MKIYTKTGDQGETALYGGKRISKGNLQLEAYGTVDELISHIGLLRDQEVNKDLRDFLKEVQDLLFTLGSYLAADPEKTKLKKPGIYEADIEVLEKAIDLMEEGLEPLKQFVLPGGHQSVSFAHIARTVCRRAERCIVRLNEQEPVEPLVIQYVNRLSDYLFVLSRHMTKLLGSEEVLWTPRAPKEG